MVKRIAGESVEREIVAREGAVYITQRYVYKVFGKKTNPYDSWEDYNVARTNRALLGSIILGLENAQELGVTDPQGFINVNSNPPLTFIDIHFRGGPNWALEGALQAARERLGELN